MSTKYHDFNGRLAIIAASAYIEHFQKTILGNGYSKKIITHQDQRLSNLDVHIIRVHGAVYAEFKLYDYSYPDVTIQKNIITRTSFTNNNAFYDDTLEDKLGGKKEVLG